jgi:hypothetical protein
MLKNMSPKVSCICPTRGRFEVLRESISLFILQDYPNKELIIFNNHPIPLIPHPKLLKHNIKVINGGDMSDKSMNLIYKETLKYVSEDAEYISIWDDDDVYFPWHLSENIELLENSDKNAIRSKQGYWQDNNYKNKIDVVSNVLEASMIVKKSYIYFENENYAETDTSNHRHPHINWYNSLINSNSFLYNNNITAMFRWNYGKNYRHLSASGPHKNEDTGKNVVLRPNKVDYIFYDILCNIHTVTDTQLLYPVDEQSRIKLYTKLLSYNIDQFNHIDQYNVWIYWDNSEHTMPLFIEDCINTIRSNTFCNVVVVNDEYIQLNLLPVSEHYYRLNYVNKSDYLRIFLLYKFGGFYFDSDTIIRGDLDFNYFRYITSYETLFPWERDVPYRVISAVFGARIHSRVFKEALQNIENYLSSYKPITWSELGITGIHNTVKKYSTDTYHGYKIGGLLGLVTLQYTDNNFTQWDFSKINKKFLIIILHGSTLNVLKAMNRDEFESTNVRDYINNCINDNYEYSRLY